MSPGVAGVGRRGARRNMAEPVEQSLRAVLNVWRFCASVERRFSIMVYMMLVRSERVYIHGCVGICMQVCERVFELHITCTRRTHIKRS